MRADVTARSPAAAPAHPDWSKLLVDAVSTPGVISQAYNRFWNFSTGNQLLALFECFVRHIEPGPLHTFQGWLGLGRHVRKGERAISLIMPITVKRKAKANDLDSESVRVGDGAERQLTGAGGVVQQIGPPTTATVFAYKPHWFVLSQTQGDTYIPPPLPEWDEPLALHGLGIKRVPFAHLNGNCQGYASGREISVSPIAALPHKTLFHEIAHVGLGHTEELARLDDHDHTPRSLREVEAECVALICCESLNLSGATECRGYIQHWLPGDTITDRSAQRIFKAADQILKAGRQSITPE